MVRVALYTVCVVAGVNIPNVTLNNGVQMPMISLGTWQFDDNTTEAAVKLALETGFNHIDTANNYRNQGGVGKALAQFDRSKYFITTKIPAQNTNSYAAAAKLLEEDLTLLQLPYVDLMLMHSPPSTCSAIQQQWQAMEDFYKAGKAKAIGVSNFCQSSFDCLAKTWTVKPTVNQIELHVGMGPDPTGIVSYGRSLGVEPQAYSPLGDGSTELITGALVTNIGKAHGMSGAQVSMRWLIEHGISLSTKTNTQAHMLEDLAIFGFATQDAELQTLDKATSPAGKPSWACSKLDVFV